MKIAAFPKCYLDAISHERSMTVFDWITMAAELPVDGLEMYEGFFTSLEPGYLDSVSEAISSANFEMPMLCCSPDFTAPSEDDRKKAIDFQIKMVEATKRLGGRFCRVLTGQRYPEVTVEQGVGFAKACIEAVLPIAKELDIVLSLENHYKDGHWKYPEFAQKKDVFLKVLEAIPEREYFGVQYDPSNAIVAGDDPIELLRDVVDRVVTMHASDRYLADGTTLEELRQADGTLGYSPNLKHGVTGQGLNDYDQIFSILSEAGYDGWVSIEDGMNGMDEMRDSAIFLGKMRDKYFSKS